MTTGKIEGTVYGTEPVPRALLVYAGTDSTPATTLAEQLSDRIPTTKVTSAGGLAFVRQAPFGLAVVFGDLPAINGHAQVVQFGGSRAGDLFPTEGPCQVRRNGTSHARQWIVPTELDETTRSLVVQDLLPLVPGGNEASDGPAVTRTVRATQEAYHVGVTWPDEYERRPLLVDADGQMFALSYRRRPDGPWHWVLPDGAHALKWVLHVLNELHAIDPENFPVLTGWAQDSRYQTAAEVAACTELAAIEVETTEVLRKLVERKAAADQALLQATEVAESGPRLIVREQGKPLSQAVGECLRGLGFGVVEVDDQAAKGDLLEDLRVSRTEAPDEMALVEVRGYSGGAQSNDLLRIGRFAERFILESGHPPARRWYIANQFAGKPPVDRGVPLSSKPQEVATFADVGGSVLGTPDLLELALRVERGDLLAEEARKLLWDARGYFTGLGMR